MIVLACVGLFAAVGVGGYLVWDKLLADSPGLIPTRTAIYNMPVVPLSSYNNTVVLGSFLGWVVLAVPIFFLARLGVSQYRARVLPRLKKMRVFKAVKASKLYNLYRLFQPE